MPKVSKRKTFAEFFVRRKKLFYVKMMLYFIFLINEEESRKNIKY